MIGFLLKKSFWDFWDRMGVMVLINLGYLLILGGGFFLVSLTLNWSWLFYITLLGIFLLGFVYTGMVTGMVHDMINNKSYQWKRFIISLKETYKRSIFLAVAQLILFFLLSTAFRYYLGQVGNLFSLVAFFMLFWIFLYIMMATIWYYPLYHLLKNSLKKQIKKCFLLTLDNTALSIFLVFWSLLIFGISAFLIFLVPGFSALLVLWHNALKLLMYKYDYLEEHEDANRKKIPWRAILRSERDKLGKRGLGDLIRPGKMN